MTSPNQSPAERPPGFVYRKSKGGKSSASLASLHCEDVSLTQLAAKHGTPLYVYSSATIHERYEAFDSAFRDIPHTICYSVKANSNLSILRLLAKKGCGFDVVSGGELERVLIADRKAVKSVVFSGVGKTRRADRRTEGRDPDFQCRERIGVVGSGRMRGALAQDGTGGAAGKSGCRD